MVNIVAPMGITPEFERNILEKYKCDKCSSMKLRPVAFVRGGSNSVFLFQCIDCYEYVPLIFTKNPISTPDAIINIVNKVGDLNKQIQEEASHGTCSKCQLGKYKSIDFVKCNRMTLDIVECNNCHFSFPVISVVRSTLFAYSYDIQLAKRVATDYPEIALVFCVAALETYFRQLFQYHSELNAYLVERRRVNFQSLDETKTIVKKEFGIDIVKLIEKDWSFLGQNFKKRHCVIHNASYDITGKKIKLSEQEINRLFAIVDDLVYKTEMSLFNNNVIL